MGPQQPAVDAVRLRPDGRHAAGRLDQFARLRRRVDRGRPFRHGQQRHQGRRRVTGSGHRAESGQGRARDARGSLRPVRRQARDRSHGGEDRHEGDRTRVHRPGRSGRAEPPRTPGGRADAWRGVDPFRDVVGDRRPAMRPMTVARALLMAIAGLAVAPPDAAAQLDPLLLLEQKAPNIIVVVDTANRMQRDQDGNYRDAHVYTRIGAPYERAIGIRDANTSSGGSYRRMYVNLHGAPGDGFTADRISTTGDRETGYATFDDRAGIGIARRSVTEAIDRNFGVARFGLVKMRQAANAVYDTNVAPGAGP